MTIERVARWLRRADRVVYLVGAGLSVPSGIRA
jgi:NAD-dependent SIR2 family protein deacetylase